MSTTFAPGDWCPSTFGYGGAHALVLATSRHKRRMTLAEIDRKMRGFVPMGRVTWHASTKQHREDEFCECDPGGFCARSDGMGWVEVLLARPVELMDAP